MRDGLGHEILWMAYQDSRVVSDPKQAARVDAQLPSRLSTQVEANLRERHWCVEMAFGNPDQNVGALDRVCGKGFD